MHRKTNRVGVPLRLCVSHVKYFMTRLFGWVSLNRSI